MTRRNEYRLDLSLFEFEDSQAVHPDVQLRAAQASDLSILADLMIDAYRGTIDYDDETIEDAINEVQAYLDGLRGGVPMLDVSRVAFRQGVLVSACLAAKWDQRRQPIIAYLMTRTNAKRRGLAKYLLTSVLREIQAAGHAEVRAVITEGNTASERLFINLGFDNATASEGFAA